LNENSIGQHRVLPYAAAAGEKESASAFYLAEQQVFAKLKKRRFSNEKKAIYSLIVFDPNIFFLWASSFTICCGD
jgi:hypothetical protein